MERGRTDLAGRKAWVSYGMGACSPGSGMCWCSWCPQQEGWGFLTLEKLGGVNLKCWKGNNNKKNRVKSIKYTPGLLLMFICFFSNWTQIQNTFCELPGRCAGASHIPQVLSSQHFIGKISSVQASWNLGKEIRKFRNLGKGSSVPNSRGWGLALEMVLGSPGMCYIHSLCSIPQTRLRHFLVFHTQSFDSPCSIPQTQLKYFLTVHT